MRSLEQWREIWLVDAEFTPRPGECVQPICTVARELRTRRTIRWWEDDLRRFRHPPHDIGTDALFVAYAANAELGCYLQLGWSLPEYVLDLFVEFRQCTNGLFLPAGDGLLGALEYFGHSGLVAAEKTSMQQLAARGGPWTLQERQDLLAYCESDVDALETLLSAMLPFIDVPRALVRGRYQRAVATIERRGIPIDTTLRLCLEAQWGPIQQHLITEVAPRYNHCYTFHHGEAHFQYAPLEAWIAAQGLDWPLTPTGKPCLETETLKDLSLVYPQVEELRQLRKTLGRMRIHNMAVGSDGRNRPALMPFRSKTGRNQPKTGENVMGASAWLLSIIKSNTCCSIAYVDWDQQEYGIGAALSQDGAMVNGYYSKDPYISFAIATGAVPPDATKASHPYERDIHKTCVLGMLYGLGRRSLARKIGRSVDEGRDLIRNHQRVMLQICTLPACVPCC
jgi:hypothetical protein